MAVSVVDAMDGLAVGQRARVTLVTWRRRKKPELTLGLHDLHLHVADLRTGSGAPGAPVAYVVMMVVVVMVVMDQVVDGCDPALALSPAALAIHGAVGVDLFPPLVLPVGIETQRPSFDLPEDVADVL